MHQHVLITPFRLSGLGQRVSGEGSDPTGVLHEAFEYIAMCNDMEVHGVTMSPYQEEAGRQAANYVNCYFAMATRQLREGEDG